MSDRHVSRRVNPSRTAIAALALGCAAVLTSVPVAANEPETPRTPPSGHAERTTPAPDSGQRAVPNPDTRDERRLERPSAPYDGGCPYRDRKLELIV